MVLIEHQIAFIIQTPNWAKIYKTKYALYFLKKQRLHK